jgi:hypothetical protein
MPSMPPVKTVHLVSQRGLKCWSPKFSLDFRKRHHCMPISPLLGSPRLRCLAKSRLCRDYRGYEVLLHFSECGLDNWMYNAGRRNPC